MLIWPTKWFLQMFTMLIQSILNIGQLLSNLRCQPVVLYEGQLLIRRAKDRPVTTDVNTQVMVNI